MVIDPVTGLLRFMNGDASRVADKPAEMVPSALGGMFAGRRVVARHRTPAPSTRRDNPFSKWICSMATRPPVAAGRRTTHLASCSGSAAAAPISEAKAQGRLLGQPMNGGSRPAERRAELRLPQERCVPIRRAVVHRECGVQRCRSSSSLAFRVAGWGGLTALGAVDSIPLTGVAPETPPEDSAGQGVSEGPRYYDYGPGGMFGARVVLVRDGRAAGGVRLRRPPSLQP